MNVPQDERRMAEDIWADEVWMCMVAEHHGRVRTTTTCYGGDTAVAARDAAFARQSVMAEAPWASWHSSRWSDESA